MNWPDKNKPGYPINPDMDGEHVLMTPNGISRANWVAKDTCWYILSELINAKEIDLKGYSYIGKLPNNIITLDKISDRLDDILEEIKDIKKGIKPWIKHETSTQTSKERPFNYRKKVSRYTYW